MNKGIEFDVTSFSYNTGEETFSAGSNTYPDTNAVLLQSPTGEFIVLKLKNKKPVKGWKMEESTDENLFTTQQLIDLIIHGLI